ncbi:hypothetical protein [uncultured Hymenobacter sp.]|uniref:hypothetical protein n=1 Tax=uncultured Hymenobacter sp. TaxID=170016 RepID=UPI0035CACC63
MANKFANILGFLGMGSDKEAVTEAHLQAADDKIAGVEQARAAAELRATTAEGSLATVQASLDKATADLGVAQGALTESQGKLTAAEGKVATLEGWKKAQQATDGRSEDESNKLDDNGTEPKAAFELEAAAQISRVKSRLGEKK